MEAAERVAALLLLLHSDWIALTKDYEFSVLLSLSLFFFLFFLLVLFESFSLSFLRLMITRITSSLKFISFKKCNTANAML